MDDCEKAWEDYCRETYVDEYVIYAIQRTNYNDRRDYEAFCAGWNAREGILYDKLMYDKMENILASVVGKEEAHKERLSWEEDARERYGRERLV